MAVRGIDHVNIRTLDLARTVKFYTEVLGLRYPGVESASGFGRNWLLDDDGNPIIHLRELAPSGGTTGAIDHVALRCQDLAAVMARLQSCGIEFIASDRITGLTQLFLEDPNGVRLELNFAGESLL